MLLTSREIKDFAAQSLKELLDEQTTERAILLNAYIKGVFKTIEDAWDLDLLSP